MEEFIVTSNYPKEEYIKYLESVIDSAEVSYKRLKNKNIKFCVDKGINETYRLIKKINNESLFYSVMDMLFAGEIDKASEMCSKDTLELCLLQLNNPKEMIKEIYVDFARKYKMKNKYTTNELVNSDSEANNNEA